MKNIPQFPETFSSGQHPISYRVGDRDERPWGSYVVTGIGMTPSGEEYCEKTIVIKPGKVLSLQSHDLRRETWTVEQGVLTALLDGGLMELDAGQSIHIPRGSLHCMANLSSQPCIVRERQEGRCCESDIRRYMDAYSRATEAAGVETLPSIAAYAKILADIEDLSGRAVKSA